MTKPVSRQLKSGWERIQLTETKYGEKLQKNDQIQWETTKVTKNDLMSPKITKHVHNQIWGFLETTKTGQKSLNQTGLENDPT